MSLEARVSALEHDVAALRAETHGWAAHAVAANQKAAAAGELLTLVRQDVNEIKSELRGHTETLNEHGQVLASHTETLREHGQVLASHTEVLNGHTEILNGQTETLREHGQMLREILDRLA